MGDSPSDVVTSRFGWKFAGVLGITVLVVILLTLVVQLACFREPGLVVRVAPGLATGAQQPSPSAIDHTSSDINTASIRLDTLTQRLASYERELDAVNRVATALIGLASLYALALGVSQYLSTDYAVKRLDRAIADAKEDIKDATARSKESATVVQQMQGDLARQYPMMQGLGTALSGIVDQLNKVLKTTEEREVGQQFDASEQDRFKLTIIENVLPLYYHFTVSDSALSEMFRGVGRFYLDKYAARKSKDPAPELLNDSDLMRAEYYLERAIRFDTANHGALNDLAWLQHERGERKEAAANWRKSLSVREQQQRARYNLAIWRADEERDLKAAIDELTMALKQTTWERYESHQRVADLLYNRACYYGRWGAQIRAEEGRDHDPHAEASLKDLVAYLEKVVNVDEEARKDLARDLADDLKWVAERRPNEMAKIKQQMGL